MLILQFLSFTLVLSHCVLVLPVFLKSPLDYVGFVHGSTGGGLFVPNKPQKNIIIII